MNFARIHISIWLVVMVLVGLVACTIQEATPLGSELASVETTPTSDEIPTTDETAEPTTTATPTPPTPTATEVQISPTAEPTFLCPGKVLPEEEWECRDRAGGARSCVTANGAQELRCYEDLDHPFALLLLANWSANVANQEQSGFPGTIIKEHDITIHDDAQLESAAAKLSVFLPGEESLTDWLTNRQRVSPDIYPITETNASVAGHPATIWINDCSPQFYRDVQVVVHNGDHVFWWRHYAFNEAGVLALQQLLDSMRFSEETAVPAETPDDIWQEVRQERW